ncbi:hypothetical protein [Butyrivibrio sp. AE2032]|uniref:hypothetical protein n=1 Tax=Butyrivibrio sp. AE2032 TaxID=1458463 RepID=UPI0005539AA6|nr:hypothetical protein [Butyrivibrio sp. AE2032]
MDLIQLLEKISVLNKDNSRHFTNTERLDVIASLLWDSGYRRLNADGLFNLYSRQPVDYYRNRKVVVVSTHVDCERTITRCFSRREENGLLKGTYDNAITNAAILSLMLSESLPDNVLVAFTGDEEEESEGALQLARFLRQNSIEVFHLFVLDVTDEGWSDVRSESASFTIENDFWDEYYGEKIVSNAIKSGHNWKFVPGDPSDVPSYVPVANLIRKEAAEDESWDYDEKDIDCCSFCLPVKGEMHSNVGVFAWESSFEDYTEVLNDVLNLIAGV